MPITIDTPTTLVSVSSNSLSDTVTSLETPSPGSVVSTNVASVSTDSVSVSTDSVIATPVPSSKETIIVASTESLEVSSRANIETISVPGSKGLQGPAGLPGNSSSITSLILPAGVTATAFTLDLLQYRSTTLFISCIDVTNSLIHKEFTVELSPGTYTVHSITTSITQAFGVPVSSLQSLPSSFDCILTNKHSQDLSIKILDLSIEL